MSDEPSSRTPPRRLGIWIKFLAASALAGVVIAIGITPAIAATGAGATSAIGSFNGLPEFLNLQNLDQRTTFYATKGGQEVPIAQFYAQNRVDVNLSAMSKYVKDAAVDTEDPRFYQEGGIDVFGTIRAALADAAGRSTQGGSSITQQYVKNILVQQCDAIQYNADASAQVREKQQAKINACYQDAAGTTLSRKIREVRYAMGLTQAYSKDTILRGYLNIAGFGGQVYGVEAAAQYYFGTTAANLTLPQAATLVAMLNNPNNLRIDETAAQNPGSNAQNGFKATLARRNYVLARMLAHHSITQAEYTAAVALPITPAITPTPSGCSSAVASDAAYFCDYVRSTMLQNPAFGKTAAERAARFDRGGLNVYTTLNLDLQSSAQTALSHYIPSSSTRLDLGASDASMEVGTGRVVTMVQNTSYNNTSTPVVGGTSVNYNTDYDYGGSQGFQTGSSFKAFDLAAWFEAGHSIYETVNASRHSYTTADFPASCKDMGNSPYYVTNDDGEAAGNISVLTATEESVNTAFAKMATELDLCNISTVAKKMGLHTGSSNSPSDDPGWQLVPSMILGVNYIAPLTMAEAYAGIANNGVVCTPIAIDKIVTTKGQSVDVPKTTCTQGMPSDIAAAVSWTLQHVLSSGNGTAYSANPRDGVPIFGKTGTTDGSVENWLVTSTTKVANVVWVGNVQGKVALRSQYFHGVGGGNVKFAIAKPILQELNRVYGGAALPTPSSQYLYGSDSSYTPNPTPTYTQAPTPTQSPTTPTAPAGPTNAPTQTPGAPKTPATGANPPAVGLNP